MNVKITRRGGLAGVTLGAELATTDLDGDTQARVEKAVDRLFEQPASASPPQPDRFHYEISVPERRDRSVSVPEHELPEDLRPLVDMLSKSGTIESRKSRSEASP